MMKLNKVRSEHLDQVKSFCENRILTAISNIPGGFGNPVEELDQLFRILRAVNDAVPADFLDANEPERMPRRKRELTDA